MLCLSDVEFVLASRNQKKIKELRTILLSFGIDVKLRSLEDIGFTDEIDEDGNTFEENAVIKASCPAKLGYIGIADDSGLCVDALGGAPGIYSARYSGGDDNDNNKKVLSELQGVPYEQRTARYVCAMACVFPDGDKIVCTGTVEGKILEEERGDGGFGYDPMFYYEPYGVTFGELEAERKNEVSHRYNAIKKLADELKRKYKC